jgi:hypothetical protein
LENNYTNLLPSKPKILSVEQQRETISSKANNSMYKENTRETMALIVAVIVAGLPVWSGQMSNDNEYSDSLKKSEEKEMHYVIDPSYIDYSGEYADCVVYADSYKDNHDYVVVSAKTVIRDTAE